jgi:mRNA interferase MazF
MQIYRRYSIVSVPFPFTDKNFTKKRPALILSQEEYQENTHHCILAMITSAKQSHWADDIEIEDLEIAGLPGPSIIRFKVFTLEESLILKTLGKLSEDNRKAVVRVLKNILIP